MKGSPVYHIMQPRDIFDFILISVILGLTQTLIKRNESECRVRLNRLNQIKNLIEKVEQSYKGYLPDQFINRATKFIDYMQTDLNSLLNDIKTIKKEE